MPTRWMISPSGVRNHSGSQCRRHGPCPSPAAPAQQAPARLIANREPPPPAVSREHAAAVAQALPRAALKPMAPTPAAGEAPTNFDTSVAALAPVSSESQRVSVRARLPTTRQPHRRTAWPRRGAGCGQPVKWRELPCRRLSRRWHSTRECAAADPRAWCQTPAEGAEGTGGGQGADVGAGRLPQRLGVELEGCLLHERGHS